MQNMMTDRLYLCAWAPDEGESALRRLGHKVELILGRYVYFLDPWTPVSAHERLEMLQRIRARLSGAS
ncbi:hypothetical protein [Rhodovulum adriaticum]|uniref:hypothetical protein n=1 Tax=Rhodovulum adriaticum TaxID=35804 RepID=UPI0010519B46|nr:hypothetical protein [Rhodovulum adriaticum]